MYQMLTRPGFDGATTSTALTAVGLLSTATLFVLPMLALPAILFGLAVRSELLQGAILGGVLGIFLLTGASILLGLRPRRARGRPHPRLVRAPRAAPPGARSRASPQRLVESRDFVRSALAESWKQAVPAALGNQLFDFLALYVSLLAVGSRVDPVLVLLAFVAGSALAMIPITPGWARLRRGRAHRCAHARRRHPRPRGARDAALPAVLVLAAAARRARRRRSCSAAATARPPPRPDTSASAARKHCANGRSLTREETSSDRRG